MVTKFTIPENLTETDCNQKPEIQPTQLNIICIVICILKIRKTENDAKNILQNLFEQQKSDACFIDFCFMRVKKTLQINDL